MNIDVQTLLIEMAKAKMSIKELSEKSEVCRGAENPVISFPNEWTL